MNDVLNAPVWCLKTDAIWNEKQCYMFPVDQRYFAYYTLHSMHKKIFSEGEGKKQNYYYDFLSKYSSSVFLSEDVSRAM